MFLIAFGSLLIICGVALTATRTASRGKLSDPHAKGPGTRTDTLEPRGRGRWLSIKTDLPGFSLMLIGGLLLFMGAFV